MDAERRGRLSQALRDLQYLACEAADAVYANSPAGRVQQRLAAVDEAYSRVRQLAATEA